MGDSKGSNSQNMEICKSKKFSGIPYTLYGKILSKGFTALNEWPMNGQFCEASG